MIFEDGEQMRDFVSVNDIVRANMLAMERPESDGEVINIGSGKPITIRQVADMLARSLGKERAAGDHEQVSRGRHSALLCGYHARRASCWDMSRR